MPQLEQQAPLAGADDDADGGDGIAPSSPPPPRHDAPYGAEAPHGALLPRPSRTHARRPAFHVSASGGFCSDPAGPVFWRGWYHIFFQHQPKTCQWHWGLGWAHAASRDLVRWVRLPPALVPGPDPASLDADGCFSGTAAVDPATGLPTLLYTGVFLKTNEAAAAKHGLTPPHGAAPYTRFVESQLAAVPAAALIGGGGDDDSHDADADDDPLLVRWSKLPEPVVRWPPSPEEAGLNPGRKLACWRDPWLVCGAVGGLGGGGARPSLDATAVSPRAHDNDNTSNNNIPPPTLLLCSGTVDRETDAPRGGAVLAFAAPDGLAKPWRCLGLAAEPAAASSSSEGEEEEAKEEGDDKREGLGCSLPGRDWEMPRVAWIPLRQRRRRQGGSGGGGGGGTSPSSSPSAAAPSSSPPGLHALVMSPDACDQPPVYALGHWEAPPKARFDLERAAGPWPLDLGRTFYAATVWEQPRGKASEGGFWGGGEEGDGGEDDGGHDQGGRTLLWGWLQEHRPEVPPPPAISAEFDHAGCLSLPRVLTLVPLLEEDEGGDAGGVSAAAGDSAAEASILPARPPSSSSSSTPLDPRRYRIFQEPLPELAKLRSPVARWAAPAGVVLCPGAAPLRVGVVGSNRNDNGSSNNTSRAVIQGTHLDIEAEFEPVIAAADGDDNNNPTSAAAAVVAVAFRSWRPDGAGAGLLSYDWRSGELVFAFDDPQPTAYDERPFAPAAHVAAARSRVGGRLERPPKPGEPLRLRVLVDGSVVEVFTGGGEVLSTRIYRGEPMMRVVEGEEEEQGVVGGLVAAPTTPTGSEQGGGVVSPPADAPSSLPSSTKAPCPCACGVEVLASGSPVRVRRLEAWEVLKGCLDPLLVLPGVAGRGVAAEGASSATAPMPADLSSSSMASLLAAVSPLAAEDVEHDAEGKLTAAEIGRAAVAAVDAAEREAEELALAVAAAKGEARSAAAAATLAATAVAAEEDTPLSPPPTRQPSMLEIPAVTLQEEEEKQQQNHQQNQNRQKAPPTPELSPAFLRAIDLRDAAREEDARQAAARLVGQEGKE